MISKIFLLQLFVLAVQSRRLIETTAPIKIVTSTSNITDFKTRVGISTLNYADSDARRSPGFIPFADVMKDMNPGMLRFPGGIEASSYLWATAPTWEPESHAPVFKTKNRWPNSISSIVDDNNTFVNVMNFDEFMTIANNVQAEVSIVINFESMYTTDGPSKEMLIETAVQMIRYCKRMNYTNVKYWEIGNESDMVSSYNGRPPNATVYAHDAYDFIEAMKIENPDILVGINGAHEEFILETLNIVGEYINFLIVHQYPVWNFDNGYKNFTDGNGDFYRNYTVHMNALGNSTISQKKKDELFVLVTETSVIDWDTEGGWSGNDVGHALALFEVIGKLMKKDRIKNTMIWTSHWVDPPNNRTEIYNLLNETNGYNAIAYGMIPWSTLGDVRLMNVSFTSNKISVYLVENKNGTSILLMNKMKYEISIDIDIVQENPISSVYVFHGESDTSKTFITTKIEQKIPTVLLPLSITVVRMDGGDLSV